MAVAITHPMELKRRDHGVSGVTTQGEPMWPRRGEASSLVGGAFWMVVISLALFFVPLINGLVGGLVGGYMVGTPKRGLIAAALPAIVVAIVSWIILAVLELPVVGFVAGIGIFFLVLLADVGLFLGALIGGALAARGQERSVI